MGRAILKSVATWTWLLLAALPVAAFPFCFAAGERYLRWRRSLSSLRRPGAAASLPSAAETRGSIARFQKAVMRLGMIDVLWEHWLRGRLEPFSSKKN